MSLNGLDDASIKEAFEAASSEPGGWFLLKYASRDEIDLLGKGTGGIVEVRDAIAAYDEASPLYGFLKYRRRNVIIKYMPENCSRLVQARVTVHFNAVCEAFAPYNTTFSIAEAKELKDTKLSAACSLHTASSSTSSSTSSLRRRRLVEIAEEEEEEQHRATKRQSLPNDGAPPITLNAQLASVPDESQFAGSAEPPAFTGSDRPRSPTASLDSHRQSSHLSRSDTHNHGSYPYASKPKVKLAPRPSVDASGRPRTAAGNGANRPVSSIPAGFKMMSKGSRRGRGERKTDDDSSEHIEEEEDLTAEDIAAIPLPPDPSESLDVVRPYTSAGRPTSSSGLSVRSTATVATVGATPKNTMTPEKARLMKAMKLREKKKKKLEDANKNIPTVDSTEATVDTDIETPEATPTTEETSDATPVAAADEVAEAAEEAVVEKSTLDDSAIDIAAPSEPTIDQASIDTQTTDSHPASPVALASEVGDSTRASSLSDSTDETVDAPQEVKAESKDAEPEEAPAAEETSGAIDTEVAAPKPVEPESAAPDAKSAEVVEPAVADPPASEADVAEPEAAEPEVPEPAVSEPVATKPAAAEPVAPEPEVVAVAVATPEPVVADTPQADQAVESSKDLVTEGPAVSTPEVAAPVAMESEATKETTELPETEEVVATPVAEKAAKVTEPEVEAVAEDIATKEPLPVVAAVEKVAPPPAEVAVEAEKPAEPVVVEKPAEREVVAEAVKEVVPETTVVSEQRPETPHEAEVVPAISVPSSAEANQVKDAEPLDENRGRRRVTVDPIRTNLEQTVAEVQSAALPDTKSRSPISGSFPNTSPSKRPGTSDSMRTVSNPIRGSFLTPVEVSTSSARSASSGAAYLHKIAQQNAATLNSKKSGNVGSSISQRIKALEKLSSTGSGPVPDVATRVERPTSSFFSVRKSTVRDSSNAPSIADRASSITRNNRETPSPPASRDSTYEVPRLSSRDRAGSGSMARRLSKFEGGNMPRGRPESVQVTARIIRDPTQQFSKMHDTHYDPSEPAQMNLKQSTLTVDHQRGSGYAGSVYAASASMQAATDSRKDSIQDRRRSRSRSSDVAEFEGPRPRRRSSLSIVKDFIKDRRTPANDSLQLSTGNLMSPASIATSKSSSRPPSVHNTQSGLSRRLSISSRKSESKDRDMNQTTPKSPEDGSGSEDANGKNGGGRASRFIRRLSNSIGSNRKNTTPALSPTVREEEENRIPPSRGSTATQNSVSYVADVNVQFPDNLLWKRRNMYLDSQGFLILSTGGPNAAGMLASEKPTGIVKRYHLSDFRVPYIPEIELQELPNSVCLDLVNGSGLQVACEDRAGQMGILQTLQEAHQSHTSFGQ